MKKTKNRKINRCSKEWTERKLEQLKKVPIVKKMENGKERIIFTDQSNSKYAKHLREHLLTLQNRGK